METIFDRFPNLSDNILKHLGGKTLANCVEVNRKWQKTIGNQRIYLIAKIQKWSTNSMRFRKEWSMAFVKIPLELLRRLAEYIMEYQYSECEYFLHPIKAESLCCKCLENAPLHVAFRYGDIELFKHIVLKTRDKSPKNCLGKTPLHFAAFEGHLEICRWYILNTEEVNNGDGNGCTPYHDAAHGSQLKTFKYLLNNGADLYLKDEFGNTAFHFAALKNSHEIGRLIIEVDKGINVNTKDNEAKNGTPLVHNAVGNIGARLFSMNTPLHFAAHCSFEMCKLIVKIHEDMDINTKDSDGKTPIHCAVEGDQLENLRIFFNKGGDLNSRTNEGDTPLHAASRYGRPEIAEFILANMADKNPVNDNGDTPLYEATKKGYLEIRKLILTEAHHLKINYYVQENFS
jgi:ankyrin repeat protein